MLEIFFKSSSVNSLFFLVTISHISLASINKILSFLSDLFLDKNQIQAGIIVV